MLTRALVSVLAAGLAAVLMLAAGQAAGGCQGTVNKTFGCVPAGCQVTVQTLACPIGAAPAGAPAGAGAAPPDPAVLAALARQTLGLPSPVIRSSPAQNALQLTNLPTWLWINPAEWVPESKTATVPGESVTATATPVSVTWHPGDGSTVTPARMRLVKAWLEAGQGLTAAEMACCCRCAPPGRWCPGGATLIRGGR